MRHHHTTTMPAWREISHAALALARRSGRPITEVILVTPELATDILKNNEGNRSVTKSKIESYAGDMASGRWQGLNGETIKIATSGDLNDGQHRLMAIVKSGVPVETLVTFGLDRTTRMTLDQGKARSPGDYLGMSGMKNGTKVAAIAHVIYCYENGLLPSARSATEYLGGGNVTKSELLQFSLDRLEGIQEAMDVAGGRMARSLATDTRLPAAFYIIKQVSASPEDVVYFFERILDGAEIASDSPILICRNKLIAEKQSNRRIPVARFLEIVVKGWNYYRTGMLGTKIQCSGSIPKVES